MKKLLLILIGLIIITGCRNYKMEGSELVGYTGLRLVIANSRVDGTGILEEDRFNYLEELVKNHNKKNKWFYDSSGKFTGEIKDNSKNQVVSMSNGTYTATFVVEFKEKTLDYKLIEYKFEEKDLDGYRFFIE